MTANSFWVIPETRDIRTPITILMEQAASLTRATKGVLKGEVLTDKQGDSTLVIRLSIVVPAMSNYRYNVLSYLQPITLYPGVVYWSARATKYQVAAEQNLLEILRQVLSAPETQNILKGLLAHSRPPKQENRRHERIVPQNRQTVLRTEDGREHIVHIQDISTSGVALVSDARPPIGSKIVVGRTPAIVVRHFEKGLAAEFVTPIGASDPGKQSSQEPEP